MELQPEGTGRRLQVSRLSLGSRIGRVEEQGDVGSRGYDLVQQLQPLRQQLRIQVGCAREVAAGPGETGDKSELDRVAADREDDRDRRGRGLCRKCNRKGA